MRTKYRLSLLKSRTLAFARDRRGELAPLMDELQLHVFEKPFAAGLDSNQKIDLLVTELQRADNAVISRLVNSPLAPWISHADLRQIPNGMFRLTSGTEQISVGLSTN